MTENIVSPAGGGQAIDTPRDDDGANNSALIVIESIDADLIAQELEGRAVEQWAYSFTDGGTIVSGLTVAGVEQCSRESAKHGEALRILKTEWHRIDEDSWFAVVEVGRYAVRESGESILLDTALGTKQEKSRKYSSRLRRHYEDPQALDKAISKAARNAKRKLLDPHLMRRVLESALASPARVVEVAPERQAAAVREAKRDAMPPPPKEKVAEDQARATFYAVAKEQGLVKQAAIHARLTELIGLSCSELAIHDIPPSEPGACHALRDAVDRYAAGQDKTKATAWEYLTDILSTFDAETEEDVPYGE